MVDGSGKEVASGRQRNDSSTHDNQCLSANAIRKRTEWDRENYERQSKRCSQHPDLCVTRSHAAGEDWHNGAGGTDAKKEKKYEEVKAPSRVHCLTSLQGGDEEDPRYPECGLPYGTIYGSPNDILTYNLERHLLIAAVTIDFEDDIALPPDLLTGGVRGLGFHHYPPRVTITAHRT